MSVLFCYLIIEPHSKSDPPIMGESAFHRYTEFICHQYESMWFCHSAQFSQTLVPVLQSLRDTRFSEKKAQRSSWKRNRQKTSLLSPFLPWYCSLSVVAHIRSNSFYIKSHQQHGFTVGIGSGEGWAKFFTGRSKLNPFSFNDMLKSSSSQVFLVVDNLNLRRIYQKQLHLIFLLSDIYFFNWNL